MKRFKHFAAAAFLSSAMMGAPLALAQDNAVDPACMMRNADGTSTVDKTKCPDGKTVGAAAAPAAPADNTTTATTTAAPDDGKVFVPADAMKGAKLITASDFIGKRIYSKAGEDIGEVNDVVLSTSGQGGVNAVILGVGGFLGIGEKDVLVSMSSIEMVQDSTSTKLVINATKDQLTAAPAYDRKARTYMN